MLAHTGCQGRGVTGVIRGGQRFGERPQCRLAEEQLSGGRTVLGSGRAVGVRRVPGRKGLPGSPGL